VFEDADEKTGFIMLPDLKWDGEKSEELYLVAIVRRKDIGSLRDLRHEHIDLLENVLTKGKVRVLYLVSSC
jgi:m7GpppX diphosphatase